MTYPCESQSFHSVWDALEDSPEHAAEMRQRSALIIALTEHIHQRGWSMAQAAVEMDVPEGQVADLLAGKIDLFNRDALLAMASAAGVHVPAAALARRPNRP